MNAMPPRAERLRALASPEFDFIVVGGGITGAGVAHDAALRGLRTALIEADDFASGTSSRSSRLVHGGVRYLEHGWLHLVFEASRERRRLLDNAPHLVRPLRFAWPVYEDQRLARWEVGAGLLLYDVLALYRNVGKHRRLSVDDLRNREPRLLADGLRGGATYWDAATDDARLTLATALAAERAGAMVFNHLEATGLVQLGTRVTGVEVRCGITGLTARVRGRVIVNATGPWTDTLRRWEDPAAEGAVRGTKGVHVLVPRERIDNAGAVTLLHPADQRVMFVLPAGRYSILGTTDTRTDAEPDQVRADERDIAYLLEAANFYYPLARLTRADVVSAWAGIRPLAANAGKDGADPSSQSREHQIDIGPGGVVAVSGGKLTTYRSMAEEIVDVALEHAGRRKRKCMTAHATLPGGDFDDIEVLVTEATHACGDAGIARHLVYSHGTAWRDVWALGKRNSSLRERIVPTSDAIRAELVHAVRHEYAWNLSDLLVRRTHVAFEARDHGASVARDVARLVAPDAGWDAAACERVVADYEQDAARLFGIDPDRST